MNKSIQKQELEKKKELAKMYYCEQRLTQKDTYTKVGVSAKTMCKWVEKYGWDELRVSLTITKDAQLKRFYAQLEELNDAIVEREKGKRYANSQEADTIVKITSAIEKLEIDTGLKDIITVFKEFNNFVKSFDLKAAQNMIALQDKFIQSRIK